MSGKLAIQLALLALVACSPLHAGSVEPALRCDAPPRVLDAFVSNTGTIGDIAIRSDGRPVISYVDHGDQTVKLAICDDPGCTGFQVRTLASQAREFSADIDLKLAANIPHVAFHDDQDPGFGLRLYVCSDSACSAGALRTLTTTQRNGIHPALVMSAGIPLVAYHRYTQEPMDFWMYRCDSASCAGGSNVALETSSLYGFYPAGEIGSDAMPVFSYAAGKSIRLYRCSNASCSAGSSVPLDAADQSSLYTSIAIGADGWPVVAYAADDVQTGGSGDLRMFDCASLSCNSGASTILDADPVAIRGTSIAMRASGKPLVAYHARFAVAPSEGRLAQCTDSACAHWHRVTLPAPGAYGNAGIVAASAADSIWVVRNHLGSGELHLQPCAIPADGLFANGFE